MKNWIISIMICLSTSVFAQVFPEGIPFQAQLFGASGNLLSNATVGVQFNIRQTSTSGSIVWQENHTILLNNYANFSVVVGTGASTGAGSVTSFDQINWGTGVYFLELLVDENNTSSYTTVSNERLMSVPFAFHAKTTSQQFAMAQLTDVDTAGIQVGDVLKWDGTKWVPQPDLLVADTVQYTYNTGHSIYSDTATYAMNCVASVWSDSAFYALTSGTSVYSDTADYTFVAGTALYAPTADTATFSTGNWSLTGNALTTPSTQFLGTTDSVDLVFRSYNVERMRIKANGTIGVGTANPVAGFQVENANGVVFSGTHGVGSIPATGAGTRMMFYPAKSAFRAGYVLSTNWDNAFVGNYSFAGGYNTRASGQYSASFGFNGIVSGDYSFAAGKSCTASGDFAMAAGENAIVSGDYGVALGRAGNAQGFASVAIGYHPTATANYALSLGNYTTASGVNSVAIGYRAKALHDGTFVWSDQSDLTGYLNSTAANQFMIRASGGSVFYTSMNLTTGVTLAAGSGSWSTLSDRNAKENIVLADPSVYLQKLDSIDVYRWNYIAQDSAMVHIGPMAQDFYAAFDLGLDSTTINSGDFDGVNLVLLKALNDKMALLEEQQMQMDAMSSELELLREQRRRLEILLIELERRVNEMAEDESAQADTN